MLVELEQCDKILVADVRNTGLSKGISSVCLRLYYGFYCGIIYYIDVLPSVAIIFGLNFDYRRSGFYRMSLEGVGLSGGFDAERETILGGFP